MGKQAERETYSTREVSSRSYSLSAGAEMKVLLKKKYGMQKCLMISERLHEPAGSRLLNLMPGRTISLYKFHTFASATQMQTQNNTRNENN